MDGRRVKERKIERRLEMLQKFSVAVAVGRCGSLWVAVGRQGSLRVTAGCRGSLRVASLLFLRYADTDFVSNFCPGRFCFLVHCCSN